MLYTKDHWIQLSVTTTHLCHCRVKVASDGITKIPTNREQARFSQEAVEVCQPDPVHGKINITAGCGVVHTRSAGY